MRLECRLAVFVMAQIREELVDGLGKLSVLLVGVELLTDELELIGNAVSVTTVTTAKELVALVVDLVPFFSRAILKDIALLLKAFVDVLVQVPEPALEFRVIISVPVNLVDGVDEVISRGAVGKALEEGLDVCQPVFIFIFEA
jgi:hypothetical protein